MFPNPINVNLFFNLDGGGGGVPGVPTVNFHGVATSVQTTPTLPPTNLNPAAPAPTVLQDLGTGSTTNLPKPSDKTGKRKRDEDAAAIKAQAEVKHRETAVRKREIAVKEKETLLKDKDMALKKRAVESKNAVVAAKQKADAAKQREEESKQREAALLKELQALRLAADAAIVKHQAESAKFSDEKRKYLLEIQQLKQKQFSVDSNVHTSSASIAGSSIAPPVDASTTDVELMKQMLGKHLALLPQDQQDFLQYRMTSEAKWEKARQVMTTQKQDLDVEKMRNKELVKENGQLKMKLEGLRSVKRRRIHE